LPAHTEPQRGPNSSPFTSAPSQQAAAAEEHVSAGLRHRAGGSNDIRNLWPESYRTEPWNAHVKDKLEDRLHELVCAGQIRLSEAQRAIATDWIAAYRRFVESQASN
jgi:hypothetical protein